jgi:hypothetical protein
MTFARVFSAAAACVVLGAAAAACSGSFGSGSGLPSTMASPGFGGPTTPSPVPSAASVILTYGESTSFQSLTEVGGYGGAIAFPKAPEPTAVPSPKGKNATPAAAPTPVAIAIGATLSIVKPQDGPDLNFQSGKGRKKKTREAPARALAYVVLLPTHDATLASYPRITLDVPREIATQYRDGEFGLALWNSGEKDSKYRLAVAELDTTATPPPSVARPVAAPPASARPGASAPPSPGASSTPRTFAMGGASLPPGSSPFPGSTVTPSAAPTLPPQRLLFAGTAATLKLVANRPAVFALYALPHPSASPAAKASGSASSVTRTSGGSTASSAPTTIESTAAPATAVPAAPGKSP